MYYFALFIAKKECLSAKKNDNRCRVSSPRFLYVFNNTTLRNVEVFLFGIVNLYDEYTETGLPKLIIEKKIYLEFNYIAITLLPN